MIIETKYNRDDKVRFYSPDYNKECTGIVTGLTIDIEGSSEPEIFYEVIVPGTLRESGRHVLIENLILQKEVA